MEQKKRLMKEFFVEIEIGMRDATGSQRGSSADATLRWKKVM